MKIKIISYIGLVASIFLNGCAGYREPTHGPVAYLSFTHNSEAQAARITAFTDANICKDRNNLTPLFDRKKIVKIPAGQESAFEVYGNDGDNDCTVLVSFLPQVNQKYNLYLRALSGKCNVNIDKISNGKITAIPFHTRKSNFWAVVPSDPACEPLK